jgi:hypothetical protein
MSETVEIFPVNFDAALFGKIFTSFWTKLYNSTTFSDVTLVLNGSERIKAHKVITFHLIVSNLFYSWFCPLLARNSPN